MSYISTSTELDQLIAAVRTALRPGMPEAEAADVVAACLRRNLPGPDILSPEARLGDPERYVQHILHVEPDGAFSVVALVWRPGQTTPIHDHISWCVVGVLHGDEYEELFETDGEVLRRVSDAVNATGEVCGFAPPGDIHRVRNVGADVAVSIHIYGANIAERGNSVRRTYDLPVVHTAPQEAEPSRSGPEFGYPWSRSKSATRSVSFPRKGLAFVEKASLRETDFLRVWRECLAGRRLRTAGGVPGRC